jgi:hypothetical protein
MFTAQLPRQLVYQGGALSNGSMNRPSSSLAPNALERMIARERDANFEMSWIRKSTAGFSPFHLHTERNFRLYLPYFEIGSSIRGMTTIEAMVDRRASIQHQGSRLPWGWYDIFFGGTLRNYVNKAHGEPRYPPRLIPLGGHAGFGDLTPNSGGLKVDTDELALRWQRSPAERPITASTKKSR